ncbi:hypothetical protein GCK72_002910 [Caenorhabditis remanei]|uniref:Thyrotropin-releasing hormone receptor n=1 Tax=Caenorhabditis remanei TaxID=31234 RepID=A0A6A5HU23_CAERE|nr:hypothetical protein GCK72_002910 [Caenorhabditis remanei]KAF1771085.1 hypothetical protein GCK72_002910 [Caenorhabditis remanei]
MTSASLAGISISPMMPDEELDGTIAPVGTQPIDITLAFVFSAISVIGVLGNLLVITVVLKVRGMKTPTNCYLVSLAASDTLFFFASMPHEMMYLLGPNDHYLFGKVGCVLLTYLPYLAMNTSSLSILAFTIERYYGICNPYKARTMCTVKRATCIICGIWVFSMLYHSYWLFLATLIQDDIGTSCSFRLERNSHAYKIVFLLDFVLWYVLPILCDIIIYAKIGITLSQCGDKIKKSVKPKKISVSNDMSIIEKSKTSSTSMGHYSGRDSHISGKRNSTRGKNQVVKMLAIVVAVFAICWLPYRGMVVYNSFVSDPKYSWSPDWYINLSKTLVFINCAINPILYNLMSARFRAAFKSLLSKRKNSGFKTTALNHRHRLNTMDVMSSAEPKSPLITSMAGTP